MAISQISVFVENRPGRLADITAVCQQGLNTVIGELLIAVGGHATVVQPVHQLFPLRIPRTTAFSAL